MELTKLSNESFYSEYEAAIRNYIFSGKENELHSAYQLGREALDSGKMILYAFQTHSNVVDKILEEGTDSQKRFDILSSASEFFTEFLSPFEMTFKGFGDIISKLKSEIKTRQNAVKAFKESERYYKALIGNALDIITILDANGNMKYYSPAMERVLGYKNEELIGKNAFAFVHPEDVDNVLEIFNETARVPESTASVEFRFLHKNGQWVVFESIGKNLLNDSVINGIIVNSRDITDRKLLEEIRRRYEFIVNASKDVMAIINKDYKYEAVNNAYCKAYLLNWQDMVGKHIAEILGWEIFNDILKEQIDKCFEDEIVTYEDWFKVPALGDRFLEISFYPYKSEGMGVTHVVKVKRDITDRREREEELRKSQLQLQEAQRIARLGSWEWVAEADTVFIHEETCNIFGIEKEKHQIKFEKFLSYIHPGDREEFLMNFNRSIKNQNSFYYEHRITRSDNEERILQTRGKTLTDEKGKSFKLIGTSQDVTEQELIRQAIKYSEIKYRRLFETSKEGLVLIDADTQKIIDVNPFFIEYLGYPREDILGKRLWELNSVKEITESQIAFREITKKKYIRYPEIDLLNAKSKELKIEFVSIIYHINSHKFIQCHFWDITERKFLQQEINRAAKQRTEDMRYFANSIQVMQEEERKRISRELHDDICQRLTALKFQMDIFEDNVQLKKRISLKRLHNVKKELNDLIDGVRTISTNLRPSALDHFGLVTAIKLLCSEFKKLHKIDFKFETNITSFQHYDPNIEIALYRIAQEALSNCAKHAKAKIIFMNMNEEETKLHLLIKDDGSGFDPADHTNRFDSIRKHLGLTNMRERTELLGGNFKLESQRGSGTTIDVIFPLTKTLANEKN